MAPGTICFYMLLYTFVTPIVQRYQTAEGGHIRNQNMSPKQNPAELSVGFLKFLWRRPTLPGTDVPSTIGSGGLNCRVRDGNGCTPSDIVTRKLFFVIGVLSKLDSIFEQDPSSFFLLLSFLTSDFRRPTTEFRSSPRPISTGQLNSLLSLHSRPIYLVVFQGSY